MYVEKREKKTYKIQYENEAKKINNNKEREGGAGRKKDEEKHNRFLQHIVKRSEETDGMM